MKVLCVDAFASEINGGNPAGVVFLDSPIDDAVMLQTANKVGFSETAFVLKTADGFFVRYFTPVDEVDLCGHATVGAFYALFSLGCIAENTTYRVDTKSGVINVNIKDSLVWLDMAMPKEIAVLSPDDINELNAVFSYVPKKSISLLPAIVDTGLPDIMMPVESIDVLNALVPDLPSISTLSKRHGVTGVHAFVPSQNAPTHCRNFAPLYGINEEAATGTSNGALTYYMYNRKLIMPDTLNTFIQGEAMSRTSYIYSRLTETIDGVKIRIGGAAVINKTIEV